MTYRILSIAALTIAVAAPAVAAAQTPAPRANAPTARAQQPTPNRATLLRNLDNNFKMIDTNGDGTLAAPELGAAEVKGMATRAAAVRRQGETRFTQLDTNKDGQLSKAEFMASMPVRQPASSTGVHLLTPLDKNKDSKVSLDEYRSPILTRFDAMDANKDGQVTTAERDAHVRAAATRRN